MHWDSGATQEWIDYSTEIRRPSDCYCSSQPGLERDFLPQAEFLSMARTDPLLYRLFRPGTGLCSHQPSRLALRSTPWGRLPCPRSCAVGGYPADPSPRRPSSAAACLVQVPDALRVLGQPLPRPGSIHPAADLRKREASPHPGESAAPPNHDLGEIVAVSPGSPREGPCPASSGSMPMALLPTWRFDPRWDRSAQAPGRPLLEPGLVPGRFLPCLFRVGKWLDSIQILAVLILVPALLSGCAPRASKRELPPLPLEPASRPPALPGWEFSAEGAPPLL